MGCCEWVEQTAPDVVFFFFVVRRLWAPPAVRCLGSCVDRLAAHTQSGGLFLEDMTQSRRSLHFTDCLLP